MKYALLLPQLKRGGPINVVKNLINSEKFIKYKIFLICIRPCDDVEYEFEFLKNKNVQIITLKNGNFFVKLKSLRSIINYILPDIIHSHGFYPDVFLSFTSGGFKKLTTIHNIIYQDYSSRYGLKGYLFSLIHYIFLKYGKIDKIIGCSYDVEKSLKKIIKSQNIYHVYNGVNINEFDCIDSENKRKIRKVNLNLDCDVLIAFCGGVERVKKVPELVDLYINKLEGFNFKFIIIGDGPELIKIEENEKIIKLGRIKNPAFYLKLADIVVSNSSSEGYPMAVLEALASGCKVFLSEIPPHNSIIYRYPNCAFALKNLKKDYILNVLNNTLSVEQLYDISSDKMAIDYIDKM